MKTVPEALAVAFTHHQSGRLDEAEQIYRQVLSDQPNNAHAWHLLGVVAHQKGAHDEAARYIEWALHLNPVQPEANNNLGLVYQALGKLTEAAVFHRRALALNPAFAEAHRNLGICLENEGKHDEAICCSRRALELRPEFAEAHFDMGLAFRNKGMLDEAVHSYQRALELKPDYAAAYHNLGNALTGQLKLDEAADCYRRALELEPTDAETHNNQALLMLLTGDFVQGWAESEWRWKTGVMPSRPFPQPRWNGQPLDGQTILLHAEQGLGDTIQFIRYAPLIKAFDGIVLVCCQKLLVRLLATCPGIDQIVAAGEELPPFDVHLPLLSAPGVLGTTLETIPANVPYLFADSQLVDQWRQRFANLKGFRIGINWHGRTGHGAFRLRDIPLECFTSIADLPGVQLVSLQQGPGRSELAQTAHLSIFDPGDNVDKEHGAFMDTAAIMMNLDLVITSDTSIPHLAGALGVPVWLALPFAPDWRWLLDRSDTPWYPTMRLFRQKTPGDWTTVFDEIKLALAARLES
jgi:tetratricopeptide (TPR) repeat protein